MQRKLNLKMQSKWLLVVFCLIVLSWTVIAEQFYIIPSSSTQCPRDACYTLTDVVQDPTQYFTSNTVITFLPGYHQTKTNREPAVLIKNVRNISMIGYDPTNNDLKECDSLYRITGVCIYKCHRFKHWKTKLLFLWGRISPKHYHLCTLTTMKPKYCPKKCLTSPSISSKRLT